MTTTLTIPTAAAQLDPDETTIRNAVARGELPATRVGGRIVIDALQLNDWFAELPAAVEPGFCRWIIVEDLGRDALLFTRYGLVLVDAEAARTRPEVVAEWLVTVKA